LALLRVYCPEGRDADVDELAGMVIQDALKAKQEKREHEREQSA